MAARSITTKIALEGSDEIRKQLETLGKSGEDAFAKIKASGDKLNFDETGRSAQNLGQSLRQAGDAGTQAGQQISQSFSGTARQLDEANASSSRFGANFATVAAGIGVAVAAIGVAVARAISGMTESAATANEKLQAAADKSGLTAQAYEQLANRIETAGGVANATISSLQRLGQVATSSLEPLGKAGVTDPVRESLRGLGDAADQALQSVQQLGSGSSSAYSVLDADGEKATVSVIRLGEATKKLSGQAAELRQVLGGDAALKQFATADDAARLDQLRQAFSRIPNQLKQAQVAARLFGEDWRKMLDVVRQTPEEAAGADATLAKSGRQLSDAQRQNLTDYTAAATDLKAALTGTRDQVGAIFAPGGTQRAKWLTELVDEGRNWLLQLAAIKREQLDTFFTNQGGKAFIVEILQSARDFASDFAKVVRSLVLPALSALSAGFDAAAKTINNIFGTKISGQFLAIAASIGVMTGAFGLIGAVLSPIGALFVGLISLALRFKTALLDGALGGKAFWADLQALGSRAFAAIRAEIPALTSAMRALFAGDFKTAWAEFAALGERALTAIRSGFAGAEGALGEFFSAVRTGFTAVMNVIGGFAKIINAIFGTNLTADALAFYLVLAQLGGVFSTLLPAIAAVLSIISRLGGAWLVIGAAAVILYRKMADLSAAAAQIGAAFNKLLSGDFAGAITQIGAAFTGLWDSIKSEGALTWVILGAGAALFASKLLGIFGVSLGAALWAPLAAAGAAVWPLVVEAATVAAGAIALLFTPAGLIAAAILGLGALIVIFWDQFKDLGGQAWTAIQDFGAQAWQAITQTATTAWQSVVEFITSASSTIFTTLTDAASAAWGSILQGGQAVVDGLTSLFQGLGSFIASVFETVSATVQGIVSSVLSAIQSVLSAIGHLGSAKPSNPAGGTNGPGGADSNGLPDFSGGFASGGYIRGPGTGTSDSILARLSNGEYVIRAAAVEKFGPAFFEMLNRLRMPKFAAGGLVDAMAMPSMSLHFPAYAAGGAVTRAGLVSFPLEIGGQQYDLQGHPDTVAALQRHSTLRQISASNKRAPGWNR